MINVHDLKGCAPVPLGHYLKALGIFRLVSEQADPSARSWWEGELFRLATHLDREELVRFFLERYRPTPLISPWNRGSGFFKAADPGLAPLEASKAPRFEDFRIGIAAARSLLAELEEADKAVRTIKAETKVKGLSRKEREALRSSPDYKKRLAEAERQFKQLKGSLVPRCRQQWRGRHREWLDAAIVVEDEGSTRYPALLGTGGNDGRFDFTNHFMQRLGEVFDLADPAGAPRPAARRWLEGALWGDAIPSLERDRPVGQYLPGTAGGANNAAGPSGESLVNPVDFVLMLEGSVLFTSHVTRRLGATQPARAAAPFAVGAQGAGYFSAAGSDESARGEQWMPLWHQPLTCRELRRLLGEGRAQMGDRDAREPIELARAIARLGTARGIREFQRFGYIERNGQSNLAVPLGRFRVPDRIHPRLVCLDDLDPWLARLRREARSRHAPARLQQVERQLGDALFAVTQHPDQPARWQRVLLALSEVEAVQRDGSGYQAGPVPPLCPEWVRAADDGSTEFRLALTFALQAAGFRKSDGSPVDPVRRHWLPLRGGRYCTTSVGGQNRLQIGPDVVLGGRKGVDDAVALLTRRLVEARQKGVCTLPLVAARGASAHACDLARVVAGEVDLDRCLALARALMALDGRRWHATSLRPGSGAGREFPDDAWLAIRLALLPWPLAEGIHIPADPAILRRLDAGDAAGATELALRRLRAAGVGATVRVATCSAETARLWAAALAFPLSRRTAVAFVRRLDPIFIEQGGLS